jgi:hypothetical protein
MNKKLPTTILTTLITAITITTAAQTSGNRGDNLY